MPSSQDASFAGSSATVPSAPRDRGRAGSEMLVQGIHEEQEGLDADEAAATWSGDRSNARLVAALTAKERKRKMPRPLTRDRDRNRSDEIGGAGGAGSGLPAPYEGGLGGRFSRRQAQQGAYSGGTSDGVMMTLDTNFDQIDDIVNPSARNMTMPVGPKDEALQDGLWSSSPGPQSAFMGSSGQGGSVTGKSFTSDPLNLNGRAGAQSSVSTSGGSSGDAGPVFPWHQPTSTATRHASLQPQGTSRNTPYQVDLAKPGLRQISLTEAQKLASLPRGRAMELPPGRTRTGSLAAVRLQNGASSPASEDDYSPTDMQSQLPFFSGISSAHNDLRKDSATTQMSARSGVSPKTSTVNLVYRPRSSESGPSSANAKVSTAWSRGGPEDGSHHFPPPSGGPPVDLTARQGSSGSAGALASASALASTWEAPDSWAVQPDKVDDEEADSESSDEGAHDHSRSPSPVHQRDAHHDSKGTDILGSRKASAISLSPDDTRVSQLTSSGTLLKEAGVDSPELSSRLMKPRGSQISAHSATSSKGSGGGGKRPSMDLFHAPSGTSPTTPTMERQGSRSGAALGTPGGAAAAAAGVLGIRGRQKPGQAQTTNLSSRPSSATAGPENGATSPSAGFAGFATRPGTAAGPSSPAAVEDGQQISFDTAASGSALNPARLNSAPHSGKRAPLVGPAPQVAGGGLGSRNYIMRIDTPYGVRTVSIPLYTNAAGLRAIIARKSPTGARAYRLFVRDKGSERPLGESEKPAMLQRRRMEQAGYSEYDSLETLGREDHSYLLRFVYRPDSVPTFHSDQFGHNEANYTHLDLQSRNLEMVPIFLYRHADWVNSLDLSGNPMSDLPTDFIQLCSKLHSLRLSNLAYKRVPQSVKHSTTLTHLDLSNNRIPELHHIALDEIVNLKSLKVQNNRLTDLPPYFARMVNLKQLNVSNNRFDTFPAVLCELLALTALDISFNAISVLPAKMAQLRNLESLILVGNSIEQLPSGIDALSNLRKVDIRRNALQDVSALFKLKTLTEVYCEHNSVKTCSASLNANLKRINLGYNPLSKLIVETPGTQLQLVSLNLSHANLGTLDQGLLTQLPALADLILDGNQFVMLPDTIGELTELRLLSCTNNHLAALPESLGKLKKLRRLLVQNNNLKSLPSSLWGCSNLADINASSNLLEDLPLPPVISEPAVAARAPESRPTTGGSGTFTAAITAVDAGRKGSAASLGLQMKAVQPLAQALKKLLLADNRLSDDVFAVVGLLVEVEVLNLSFNDIYEVPSPSLSKLPLLRELYLSGNDLSSLPTDDLVQLKLLRTLHINANRLLTLPAELGQLQGLANLDVGNNSLKYNIANWHYDWNWNSNPDLRYLNLSGNQRLEIKSKVSGVAGANRKMDTSDFQRLTSLRVLGLMDVTVTLQQMPDEFDDRRVRTSLSQINNMAYGISDALGKFDHLALVDLVVPSFRRDPKQCLFGLFDGRGHAANAGSRIAKFLADTVRRRVENEVEDAIAASRAISDGTTEVSETPDDSQIPHILRKAFLRLQQDYALLLMSEAKNFGDLKASGDDGAPPGAADPVAGASAPLRNVWQAGASAVLVYVVDQTIHVANAGDALAVLCRGGTAHHLTTRHEPFDRNETMRIRSAEGWVSLRGYVNDSLDVSRSFGYYHLTPIVNSTPAVQTIHLNDSDEFLIIASRSLWDQMSYQVAIDIARTERDDLMIAAQKLRDFAISYGAEDDIMVMIVAVGDLFESRQQRRAGAAGSRFDSALDTAFKKSHRRDREELPSDRTLARLEREVAPPIGQVALVFTDIKNSTALWETNGGMHSAIRLHNVLLRRQLRVVGGYEVKTEGDAFMVSFPSVTSALLWCFNVQLQLLKEDWPQEILESEDGKEVVDADHISIYRGLSVRMGIHWGWPVCENDPITRRMDYFGPMVNRAARISGAADGGQIMVSRDVVNELKSLLGAFDEAGTSNADGLFSPGEDADLDMDEEEFRLLHPNVSRDVVLLRRMGFAISEVGERRLKGLETPETLHLVYPKQLAGRLATREDAPAPQVFEPTPSLLDIDDIKALGMICLRLEALSNCQLFPGVLAGDDTGDAEGDDARSEAAASQRADEIASVTHSLATSTLDAARRPQALVQPVASRMKAVEKYVALKPELLIVSIRDDAPDDELATLLEQLVVRIRNAMTTLTVRHFVANQREPAANGSIASAPNASLQELLGLLGPLHELL